MMIIPVQGNKLGFLMFVIGAVVAGIGAFILHLPNPVVMIATGLSLIIMDIGVRLRDRLAPKWLINSLTGGVIFLLPVWVLGLVVMLANIYVGLTGR